MPKENLRSPTLFLLYLQYSSGGRKSILLRHKSQSIILLEAFKYVCKDREGKLILHKAEWQMLLIFSYLFADVDECASHSRSKRSFWWWFNPSPSPTTAYGGKLDTPSYIALAPNDMILWFKFFRPYPILCHSIS